MPETSQYGNTGRVDGERGVPRHDVADLEDVGDVRGPAVRGPLAERQQAQHQG
jgi:hypothetical protein